MKIYVLWSDYSGEVLGYFSTFENAYKKAFEEVYSQEKEGVSKFHELLKNYPDFVAYTHSIDEFNIENLIYKKDEENESCWIFYHPDYEGFFPVEVYEEELDGETHRTH